MAPATQKSTHGSPQQRWPEMIWKSNIILKFPESYTDRQVPDEDGRAQRLKRHNNTL